MENTSGRGGGGGGGGLLPIHSLKWNPNDVLTTCKAIQSRTQSLQAFRSAQERRKDSEDIKSYNLCKLELT